MKRTLLTVRMLFALPIAFAFCLMPTALGAGDWPQWRGVNRDARTTGFTPPKAWPKELIQKWQVPVGRADASPAVVGDKVYLFARDTGGEVTLCLDARTGKELWRDNYEAAAATEPMGQHPGPRSSPAVAGGKVVVYGVRGILSCLDAATGKLVWRKDDFAGVWPKFFTSSSPMIVDGLCLAQLGGEEKGGLVALDLATGDRKWAWTDDGTAYASPVLMTVGGTRTVVALTSKRLIGVSLTDGKLLWELPFAPQNRAYNAATPIVDGATVIFSGAGRGTRAVKVEKMGEGLAAREIWANAETAVQFDTPVLTGGRVYGLAQSGALFCLDAKDGKSLWTAPLGGRDFGSVVDAGSVLLALTPQGELTVFEPSEKELTKLAGYKVGTDTYAYPVPASGGIYVKDKENLTLWALE